jgi:hypothetical protein
MRGLGLVAVALLMLSCGSSAAPAATSVDACGAAFAAAAGVDKNADTVADLYPAVRACSTVAAWSAAYAANNGAGFKGTATEVLTNVCGAPEVATTALCMVVLNLPSFGVPAPPAGVAEIVNKACPGTTYTRCVNSLTLAMDAFPGTLVAICEYPSGEGDVVTVDDGETPEVACSGGGLISPSSVHGTLKIPRK